MFGLQPIGQLCCGPFGSMCRLTLSKPDESHSAGLVTISVKRSWSPFDFVCVGELSLFGWRIRRRRTVTYFQDGRDVNGVGAGETEKCRLWLCCCLEPFDTPNHRGMLTRGLSALDMKDNNGRTYKGHDSERSFDVLSSTTTLVPFANTLSTVKTRNAQKTTSPQVISAAHYTTSVHSCVPSASSIFRRMSGARTSKTHLSES